MISWNHHSLIEWLLRCIGDPSVSGREFVSWGKSAVAMYAKVEQSGGRDMFCRLHNVPRVVGLDSEGFLCRVAIAVKSSNVIFSRQHARFYFRHIERRQHSETWLFFQAR